MFESIENLEDTRGLPTKKWIMMPGTKIEILNRFKNFLKTFVDAKGRKTYLERIKHMGEENRTSIELEYIDLANEESVLAYFLPEAPLEMFQIMNEALKVNSLTKYFNVRLVIHSNFLEDYFDIVSGLYSCCTRTSCEDCQFTCL